MRNEYRCEDRVYNREKKRYLRCSNGLYKYINDKKLCWCHYNKYTINSILTIQKYYRGYKCRRYIKLYKNLPDDIQIIIKRKISYQYYYNKYCNSIYKILKNRFNRFDTAIKNITNKYQTVIFANDIEFLDNFMNSIYPTYILYNKYFDIVTFTNNNDMFKDIKILHIHSNAIISRIRSIAQEYFYTPDYSNIDPNTYYKLINSIFIINCLSEKSESI